MGINQPQEQNKEQLSGIRDEAKRNMSGEGRGQSFAGNTDKPASQPAKSAPASTPGQTQNQTTNKEQAPKNV